MTLEPFLPEAESEEEQAETRTVRRRFWIAVALTLPLVVIAMAPHVLGLHASVKTARRLRWLALTRATPVVLWAATDDYGRRWMAVVRRSPNMYTLIGLGVTVAYLYSAVATFAPSLFPPAMRDANGQLACISRPRSSSSPKSGNAGRWRV